MKKWKCLVCGYIHEGDEPPEKCPVCGADASQFEELIEEDAPAEEAPAEAEPAEAAPVEEAPVEAAPVEEPAAEEAAVEEAKEEEASPEPAPEEEAPKAEESVQEAPAEEAPLKKWRCTVCNYIHEGPEPPEICPVCGADKSKFVEFKDGDEIPSRKKKAPPKEEDKPAEEIKETYKVEESIGRDSTPEPEPLSFIEKYDAWLSLLTQHHAHPIAVHIPNGLVPIAVIFMVLSMLFHSQSLGQAYFYNMIAVLLAMPWVLFTGYVDWQRVYNGASTSVFNSKIVCGLIVAGIAFIVVVWRLFQPDILMPGASGRFFFALLNFIMVGAAGYAGFQGGKLVFNK
ncbi:Rubredoxin-type Fe(Cys)4 protein [Desulfatibacillum aliphaticivorans]|uniref:Rubredoxin-type Fe(Cys)4 protein n=1 Tax=Desulfatibacillum aliphaticivorans TaxID=218208 RepID=B8FDR6_DESAL|nr:DUF2231 domain-containing protein [Desulfatibacillum aliphaticivorans]ACL06697.1 Rubredoxin-type Fe(Cys)4 protein [Desulfatibacillum aliphaticivorans]